MRGISFFQKPSYREISPMRGRTMRGPPVLFSALMFWTLKVVVADAKSSSGT